MNNFGNINEYYKELLGRLDEDRESTLEELYKSIYGFMISQLGKYREFDTIDNLMCYGNVSFMKAVEGYDINSSVGFLGYYSICLRNDIYDDYLYKYMKDGKKYWIIKKSYSLEEGYEVADDRVSIEDDVIYKDKLKGLYKYIDGLEDSELHKDIIKFYIRGRLSGRDIGYDEVCKKFNISKGYVSKIINKMRIKVEDYLREV